MKEKRKLGWVQEGGGGGGGMGMYVSHERKKKSPVSLSTTTDIERFSSYFFSVITVIISPFRRRSLRYERKEEAEMKDGAGMNSGGGRWEMGGGRRWEGFVFVRDGYVYFTDEKKPLSLSLRKRISNDDSHLHVMFFFSFSRYSHYFFTSISSFLLHF